jgi:hypothetical protein
MASPTASPTVTATAANSEDGKDEEGNLGGLSIGGLIGVAVGVLCGLLIVSYCFGLWRFSNNRKKSNNTQSSDELSTHDYHDILENGTNNFAGPAKKQHSQRLKVNSVGTEVIGFDKEHPALSPDGVRLSSTVYPEPSNVEAQDLELLARHTNNNPVVLPRQRSNKISPFNTTTGTAKQLSAEAEVDDNDVPASPNSYINKISHDDTEEDIVYGTQNRLSDQPQLSARVDNLEADDLYQIMSSSESLGSTEAFDVSIVPIAYFTLSSSSSDLSALSHKELDDIFI